MRTSNKDLQVMLPSIGSIVLFHATWEGWPVVPGIVTQVESGDRPLFCVHLCVFVENGSRRTWANEYGDEPGCWQWPPKAVEVNPHAAELVAAGTKRDS